MGKRVCVTPLNEEKKGTAKVSGPGFLFREMRRLGIRVRSESFPKFEWHLEGNHCTAEEPVWTTEWKSLAGTLVGAIEDSSWLFEAGVLGKVSGHDWLECSRCGQIQMVEKRHGAPSAAKKCAMTVACKGKLVRFDAGIFEVWTGKKKRGGSGGNRGVPIEIQKEGLAEYDRHGSATDAARYIRERHPELKTNPSQITRWRDRREKYPELYV